MSLLISKYDFIELVCKFKGHVVSEKIIKQFTENPNEVIIGTCQRCKFGFKLEIDPNDKDRCIISDYD